MSLYYILSVFLSLLSSCLPLFRGGSGVSLSVDVKSTLRHILYQVRCFIGEQNWSLLLSLMMSPFSFGAGSTLEQFRFDVSISAAASFDLDLVVLFFGARSRGCHSREEGRLSANPAKYQTSSWLTSWGGLGRWQGAPSSSFSGSTRASSTSSGLGVQLTFALSSSLTILVAGFLRLFYQVVFLLVSRYFWTSLTIFLFPLQQENLGDSFFSWLLLGFCLSLRSWPLGSRFLSSEKHPVTVAFPNFSSPFS